MFCHEESINFVSLDVSAIAIAALQRGVNDVFFLRSFRSRPETHVNDADPPASLLSFDHAFHVGARKEFPHAFLGELGGSCQNFPG